MGALPASSSLIAPAIFLLLLATAAVVVAFVPRWLARIHWGRTATAYPASRFGCFGTAAALTIMAAGMLAEQFRLLEPPAGLFLLLAGFLAFVVVGLLDRPRR